LLKLRDDVLLQTMCVTGVICHHTEVWEALIDTVFIRIVFL